MNGGLQSWDYRRVYEASNADLVDDFFVPSLKRALRYDRAAGYFRSSVFQLVAVAISDFVLRGGTMRIVCSPSLADEDEAEIRRRGVTEAAVERSITSDIEAALEDVDEMPVVQLLGTLLEHGVADLRIAYKANECGIFHSKLGIFHDGIDAVSFDGSANETYMAWEHNEERFKAFCTWRGQEQVVADDVHYFDQLWEGKRHSLVVRPLPEIPLRLLKQHALPDPEAAIERVRLSRKRRRTSSGSPRRLQDHQLTAKLNWWLDQRGIIDHVTGGGKTVTAIAIAKEWLERRPNGAVLVLVPSALLTEQWRRELDREFFDTDLRVLHVGGPLSASSWRELLPDFTRAGRVRGARIVIATMDSAASEPFRRLADVGEHSLLIADEVHAVGSAGRRSVLELDAGGRLGLSATPQRFGDEEGTRAIFDYFGNPIPPPFTIRDAQESSPPRLVPYQYNVGVVGLSAEESEQYQRITKRIGTLAARLRAGDVGVSRDQLNLQLIQRARVLKGATGKTAHAVSVIENEYTEGDRWIVYCDGTTQLEAIREQLVERGYDPMIYVSAMAFSKPDTLVRFERIGGVLLSIRCLDEGIDIPNVSHALILASSLNPREHLQRRGRVLRTSPGKSRAVIFDTLVGPEEEDLGIVFTQDLERSRAFAADAVNRRHVLWRIDQLRGHNEVDESNDQSDVEDELEQGDEE